MREKKGESWAGSCVLPMTSEKLSINSHRDSSHPKAIYGYGITQCMLMCVSVCELTVKDCKSMRLDNMSACRDCKSLLQDVTLY